jgi:uncharacterized protein DUF3551
MELALAGRQACSREREYRSLPGQRISIRPAPLPADRFQTEAIMTTPDRRTAFATAAFALATNFLLTPAPAVAAAGAPPFCVLRGGSQGGGTAPQICAYFDYQACLQAAADLHGNCVQNIDYHGDVSTAPAQIRTRHRR